MSWDGFYWTFMLRDCWIGGQIGMLFNPAVLQSISWNKNLLKPPPPSPPSTLPLHTIPSSGICQLHPQFHLQLIKAIVLAESYSFSFIFKPINTLQQSPELSQVGAILFSTIYTFICYFTFQVFFLSLQYDASNIKQTKGITNKEKIALIFNTTGTWT